MELAKLIERVPIPIKEGIEEPSAKVRGDREREEGGGERGREGVKKGKEEETPPSLFSPPIFTHALL